MKHPDKTAHKDDTESAAPVYTRRGVLHSAAGVTTLAAASMISTGSNAARTDNGHPVYGDNGNRRRADALRLRINAAKSHSQGFLPDQSTNGDEGLYDDYRASFTKALPHDDKGLVDPSAYRKLLTALESGEGDDFENIPLGGTARLANPQAAYRFELTGLDSALTRMRPAPVFAGAETAAEMGELYWKALARDIPFTDFNTSMTISSAVADLNAFSATVGPKQGGAITSDTIFRGETPGDLKGPYVSQFLLKDIPYGATSIEQRYAAPPPGADFMTTQANWLNILRGGAPAETLSKSGGFYISDGRKLGEYVHVDFTYQAYLSAALIAIGFGPDAFDIDNAYRMSASQGGFVTQGASDVLNLTAKAANLCLTGAWYQKWLVHRRLRPEVYGGRLDQQLIGVMNYGLPSDITGSEAVARVRALNGGAFLPMAFAEGSPTHPAYPAGHATVAGGCCTVLKAFFDEDFIIPSPVVANQTGSALDNWTGADLRLGDEINKLANNISLGRDWAGVHYRSDGVDGLLVGEQQAIGILRDYSRTYNEEFNGFTLTKFDGTRIRVVNGEVLIA